MTQVPAILERTTFFIVALNCLVTQMLSDQYPIMNLIGNNILPTYLGNYGPSSYANNNNIPNTWTMILNPYYLGNPPLTFSNTLRLMIYLFSELL
jgi:hypothetical protein